MLLANVAGQTPDTAIVVEDNVRIILKCDGMEPAALSVPRQMVPLDLPRRKKHRRDEDEEFEEGEETEEEELAAQGEVQPKMYITASWPYT